jgi:hypothetical protein
MKIEILAAILTVATLSACAETNEFKENSESINSEKESSDYEKVALPPNPELSFIENVEIKGDEISINYHENFSSYKKSNPESDLDAQGYNALWNDAETVEKALYDNAISLFSTQPDLQKLSVTLPTEDEIFSYSVSRNEIEKFIGADENNITLRKEFITEFVEK